MSKIKELPKEERPREKAIRYGIETLSDEELLAILLRTGTKQSSALDLAHTLHNESRGLSNLFNKSYEALIGIKGIGPGKGLILSSCFELCKRYARASFSEKSVVSSRDLYDRYSMKLLTEPKEIFILVVLNGKRKIIHEEIMYKGGENSVDCNPLEVVKKVIVHNGKSFYMIHNHPSGNYQPSESDVRMTGEIINYANKLKIPLVDHIIVGGDGYFSFKNYQTYGINTLIYN